VLTSADIASFVSLDFEATSASPRFARIVSAAAVTFSSGAVTETFYSLVDPGESISKESTQIHGIRDSDVAAAPSTVAVLRQLVPLLCRRRIIVGYNIVEYDLPLLAAECRRCGVDCSQLQHCTVYDVYQWTPVQRTGRSLTAQCVRYGVGLTRAHSADADAEATGRLFLAMLGRVAGAAVGWQGLFT
jgi:DNA polymerase III subunit epsilon